MAEQFIERLAPFLRSNSETDVASRHDQVKQYFTRRNGIVLDVRGGLLAKLRQELQRLRGDVLHSSLVGGAVLGDHRANRFFEGGGSHPRSSTFIIDGRAGYRVSCGMLEATMYIKL